MYRLIIIKVSKRCKKKETNQIDAKFEQNIIEETYGIRKSSKF